ncbi:cell division protein SepF [Timonella senegalensis]|uniref:cell division protein SepF n=1 Tax=Timonella senegalensis TaxID=1465825 RepID=UPI0028A958E8|nr:cell division protein SepF [Timonella senegalensis]
MAGALRKTMKYLGMADGDREYEDEYEEYADYEEVVEEPMDSYEAQVTPISRAFSHQEPSGFANTELRRITTVHPRSYNDARVIGEAFRDGTPVIMNLSDMDDADAKRLVDFSAGLIFGLQGNIERVTSKVFLLSPANVEISGESSDQSASSSSTQSFYNQS